MQTVKGISFTMSERMRFLERACCHEHIRGHHAGLFRSGLAPFPLHKSYVSRTAQGKSVIFLVIVLAGYCAGVLHKLFFSASTG